MSTLPNRENFVDCAVRTVRTVLTWQGQMLSWQADLVGDLAWYVDQSGVDMCRLGESGMVPRGPVMGCHVAPLRCIKSWW
jgi:hypothetical protein